MTLQLPRLPKFSERHLWHLLTVAAIVFAAGPSGAWLGQQFSIPLPYAWGWFGSVLVGLTMFGGVNLAIRGDNWGKAIVGGMSIAAVVCDWHYFAPLGHDPVTASTLAFFPSFIAIMGGIVASRWDSRQELRRSAQESEQRQWERQQAEKQADWERQQREAEARREWAFKGKQLELEAKRAEQAQSPSATIAPPIAESATPATEQTDKGRVFDALDCDPDISNSALAQQLAIDPNKVRAYRSQWRKAREPIAVNGNGH